MRRTSFAVVLVLGWRILAACGESRSPIGEECLRSDDCLSGVCSDRVCVSAPPLTLGGGEPPGDQEPEIPASNDDASAPKDAGDGG